MLRNGLIGSDHASAFARGRLSIMAKSRGRKPRPSQRRDKSPAHYARNAFDRANFAWSLLPPSGVAIVAGAFAVVAELEAWKVVLVGLAGLATAFLVNRYAPSRTVAWVSICTLIAAAAGLSYRQHQSFKLDFYDVRIGLFPFTLDRSKAAGAAVQVRFENRNDFDVWVKSDRRISSVNGTTSPTSSEVFVEKVRSSSLFGIPDEPVRFPQPLYAAQVAEGTFDYHLCYGRTEDSMTKGFTIAGSFATQFDGNGEITVVVDETVRKEGGCNED